MARVHKLLLTLASGSALYSGLVPALGLGEISLHSALNQPLDAEIELLEVGDLNDSEVRISLASADAFERAGVDRFLFLNDLRFSPIIRGSGSHIRVVSSKPVREPYLNFIIEVVRPNGRLLREYTLLLDPPASSAYAAQASTQHTRYTQVEPTGSKSPAPQSKAAPPANQGTRYEVARGDSLWTIARSVSVGSSLPLHQMMDGIVALNPQAFAGGDINRLKVGQSLLLPDAAVTNQPAVVVQAEPSQSVPSTKPSAEQVSPPVAILETQQRMDSALAQGEVERQQLRQDIAELHARLETLQERLRSSDQQIVELQTQVQRAEQVAAAPVDEPSSPVQNPIAVIAPPAQAATTAHLSEQPASHISPFWWVTMVAGLMTLFVLDWVLLRRSRRAGAQLGIEPSEAKDIVRPRLHEVPTVEPTQPKPVPAVAKAPVSLRIVPAPASLGGDDALEGANIYFAFGRFKEALEVLRPAIARDPQRLELRYRLLDVLAELRDPVAFASEEAALRELSCDENRVANIRGRLVELGAAEQGNVVEEPQFVLDAEAPASAELSNEAMGDPLSDFDGYPLDADWDSVSPFKTAEPKRKAVAQSAPLGPISGNLQELPEVYELTLAKDTLSPFGELDELSEPDGLDELTDPFRSPLPDLDLDQLDARQENIIKLNLALAYIEQGNIEAACNILNEVISDGDDQQKQEARDLLARIA